MPCDARLRANDAVASSDTAHGATHPARGDEALHADQVPLQLRQLLQVLQPGQAVSERGGHLRDDREGICVKRPLSAGTRWGAGGPPSVTGPAF